MNDIGFLDTEGILHPCDSWGHMDLALDITDDMGLSFYNRLDAEDYLKKLGWIVIRARDVYGFIGWRNPDTGKRIHLTDAQRDWLIAHYEDMPEVKRKTVDDLFDVD